MERGHRRAVFGAVALLAIAACSVKVDQKLAGLPMSAESRAALGRLRFSSLHRDDRLQRGDLLLCGERDRVVLGFSKRLVTEYLGLDSEWLIPELFSSVGAEEVLLTIPPDQVLLLELPRGIDSHGQHPNGWVREVAGFPLFTTDLRAIESLFEGGDMPELFARRESQDPAPVLPPTDEPWQLGVVVFPRMGPRTGVVIAEVKPHSAAANVGLEPGDRIVRVGQTPVASFRELKAAIQSANPSVLTLFVRPKGQPDVRPVRLSRHPGESR